MEIAKLGEFGLIDRLTKDIEKKNESTKYGVGDDCAVLSYPDKEVLITTDLLMEGVHFDLTYIDLKHLGLSQWGQEYRSHLCQRRFGSGLYGIAATGTRKDGVLWSD